LILGAILGVDGALILAYGDYLLMKATCRTA